MKVVSLLHLRTFYFRGVVQIYIYHSIPTNLDLHILKSLGETRNMPVLIPGESMRSLRRDAAV